MSERASRLAFTVNPVMVREMRARWRGWQAFILLFVYAVLFAAALGYLYALYTRVNAFANAGPDGQASTLGRNLFSHLTWIQTLGWVLIAPSLTATSIAGERERGLLDALQLSALTPWRIVAGKLFSVLSLIFLLLLVPLPISALCFMMGGISGGEFLQVFALHLVTAVTGAAIGLFCSAWHRRAGLAMRSMILFLLTWHIGSWLALWVSIALLAARPGATPSAASTNWSFVCGLFSQSNPLLASVSLFDYFGTGFSTTSGAGALPPPFDSPYVVSLASQILLTVLLLWSATRAVRKPLRETYWLEPKRAPKLQPRQTAQPTQTAPASQANPRQAVLTGRREVPLARLFRFSNPVLRRETHAKFRLRRSSYVTIIFEVMLSLFIVYLYLLSMWWVVTDKVDGDSIWQGITAIGLIAIMLATPMMGAGAFTREREGGTWEALRLSLLSPMQIIIGKLLSPLLACMGYSMIAWPLLLACMSDFSTDNRFNARITLGEIIGVALILFSTAWCYTAWGMLLSWWCRRTVNAVSWALFTIFFAVVIIPTMEELRGSYGYNPLTDALLKFLPLCHPFLAMGKLYSPPDGPHALAIGAATAACLMALGSAILTVLYFSMKRQVRR